MLPGGRQLLQLWPVPAAGGQEVLGSVSPLGAAASKD